MMQTPAFETTAREREKRCHLLERIREIAIRDRGWAEKHSSVGVIVDVRELDLTPMDHLTLARCLRAGLVERADLDPAWFCLTFRAYDLIGEDDWSQFPEDGEDR